MEADSAQMQRKLTENQNEIATLKQEKTKVTKLKEFESQKHKQTMDKMREMEHKQQQKESEMKQEKEQMDEEVKEMEQEIDKLIKINAITITVHTEGIQ
eukprot:233673_1